MTESTTPFSIPDGLIGRFAVVKLWPDNLTAEDECIARLKQSARSLGIECVEIHADGRLIANPKVRVSKRSVDFVIHLHYDTPKCYDAHSFAALWNPVRFYHEWGYKRCSRNLLTHDDFLSCDSGPADDHVARMVRHSPLHLPPLFRLYHATPGVAHPPSLGEGKLIYTGINWEAIRGGKSRHQEVLKRLDRTGLLRIHGPKFFWGTRVWAGYRSYAGELPFDGVSLVDAISKAGVALVLSSKAHKDSRLMSNRLFESVSAGALVICDENPFARTFFGDSLLYIDGRAPLDRIVADITGHMAWARSHPDRALVMIAKAQEIFLRRFALNLNLKNLYAGFARRRAALLALRNPEGSPPLRIRLCLLMPEYSEAVLRSHIESVSVQDYPNISPLLAVDKGNAGKNRKAIEAALAASPVAIELAELDFFESGIHPDVRTRRPLGGIIMELIGRSAGAEAFMVVAPNERLFSSHLGVLAGALQRQPSADCAATAALLQDGDGSIRSVHETIDFGHMNPEEPAGYGRFLFRTAAIPADIGIALPHLDGSPLAVLVGDKGISQQLPASIIIDIAQDFPKRDWDEAHENAIIGDYGPGAFKRAEGFNSYPFTERAIDKSVTPLRFVRLLFSPRWIKAQVNIIRHQGLPSRLRVLKRKLGL